MKHSSGPITTYSTNADKTSIKTANQHRAAVFRGGPVEPRQISGWSLMDLCSKYIVVQGICTIHVVLA